MKFLDLKERASLVRACLFRERVKRRQFAFLEHPSLSDLDKKQIEPELLLLHRFLEPKKMFIDAGANAGEYVYMALKYLPAGNIIAIEPQRVLVKRMRALFPGVRVERLALSDRAGEATLKIPEIRGALYRARATLGHFLERGESGARFESVPTRTLDSLRASFGIPIGCIKIDVEGHERAVLEGAAETLARDLPALIIEIEQRHHSDPIEQTFSWLAERGYRGYFFDPVRHRFADIAAFRSETHQDPAHFKTSRYLNTFIFLPAGRDITSGEIDLMREIRRP